MRKVSAFLMVIVIGAQVPGQATALSPTARFSTCEDLDARWGRAIARDESSRTRYIKSRIDNFYEPIRVDVRPRVYRESQKLDDDRDGVLCETMYEKGRAPSQAASRLGRALCLLGPNPQNC